MALGAVYLVLLVCAVALFVRAVRPDDSTEQAAVRSVAQDFVSAVARVDRPRVVALLCAEEAAEVTGDDDYPDAAGGAGASAEPPEKAEVTRILVRGDVASALVQRPRRETRLYFRREEGSWKVCSYAAAELSRPAVASGFRPNG